MKNIALITTLCALFAFPALAQQKLSAEEAAIKKVIEDETMYFDQRNYDKWAECVAHDPMAYFSWTTPFAGENAVFEARGWEEISKAYKEMMEKDPPNPNSAKKENYQFKVNGNMAYVTFMEGGVSDQVRVLEKKDGQWRILRVDAINSTAFKKFQQLHALQRMAGTWEIDLASFKKSAGDWSLISTTLELEQTPSGLSTTEHSTYRNAQGELRVYEEQGMVCLNMQTGVIGALSAPHYPYSGWTEVGFSTGKFDEKGVLHLKGSPVGDTEHTVDTKIWMEGENMKFSQEVKDNKGEEVYAVSYQLNRKGAVARP